MRALGIDPGTLTTGYGIVEQNGGTLRFVTSGNIKTAWKSSIPERLQKIYQRLLNVIDDFRPDLLVVEDTFLGKNFKSAVKLGQARGIALLSAQERGLPVFEYSPTAVKLAVAGYGSAHKGQIQQMVSRLLAVENRFSSQHVSDALAVAICHIHSAKIREIVCRPS